MAPVPVDGHGCGSESNKSYFNIGSNFVARSRSKFRSNFSLNFVNSQIRITRPV